MIGPWAHSYAHAALPQPAIGFLQESLRWWDHWLKGTDTGIMDEPMLRVWMPDAVPPQPQELVWPGRWVAENSWPPAHIDPRIYILSENRLVDIPEPSRVVSIKGAQINGTTAGVWCPYGGDFGLPIDQRIDDGLSLCFTTAPCEEPEEILGFPEAHLKLSVDQPDALLAVRLCDVAPDGASRLVSWGLLNLTNIDDLENPKPMQPGKEYQIKIVLNVAAHRLNVGHRWRVAISPTYWPHAWPSPKTVKLALHTGKESYLVLPVRNSSEFDDNLTPFSSPEGAPLLQYENLRPAEATRIFTYNETTGLLQMVDRHDKGRKQIVSNQIVRDNITTNIYSIMEGKPLSARVQCDRKIELIRADWHTRIETKSIMTGDDKYFHLTNLLDAYEGQVRVFTKSWTKKIPRNNV